MKKVEDKFLYIKHPIRLAIIISVIFSLTFLFEDQLYGIFGVDNYIVLHLILEIIIISLAVSIVIQVVSVSHYNLTNRLVYLAVMFTSVAVFCTLHAVSYLGMPYFIHASNMSTSQWFYLIERLIVPSGFILFFLVQLKPASKLFTIAWAVGLSLFVTVFTYMVYEQSALLPLLVDENGATATKNILHIIIMVVQFIFIIVVMIKGTKKRNLYHIFAGFLLLLSDTLFLLHIDIHSISNVIGHSFQAIAYFMIVQTIYYSSIEKPYREIVEAKESLEQSEKALHKMAYYDDLTSLPNERYFMEQLSLKLPISPLDKTIFIIEIERLSTISATLGIHYANILKQSVAERIRQILPGKYSLFALREQHLAVFIMKELTQKELMGLTQELQLAMSLPFKIQHYSLETHLNIGVAQYPHDAESASDLFKHGQIAMYEAKNNENHTAFFERSMMAKLADRLELENELRQAIQNGELSLHYQPQLHVETGKINSAEALLRWQNEKRGFISPLQFISLAEETGLIVPIGRWVLLEAAKQAKKWNEMGHHIKVAVNLSLGQLLQGDFVQTVRDIIVETEIKPELLQLEITESMTINMDSVTAVIEQLREEGIAIAVDDFGTGYSSLSYLKDFPLDCLKIDRSFVWNIKEGEDEALIQLILSMAKLLKLQVVAEGIENECQLRYLIESSCDVIQGYLISKPLTTTQFEQNFEQIEKNAQLLLANCQHEKL